MHNMILKFAACCLTLCLCGMVNGQDESNKNSHSVQKMTTSFNITSSAFDPNTKIPEQYTYKDKNMSPELAWPDPPSGTKAFALICDDPDAPGGDWVHWVIYDIPASERNMSSNIPKKKIVLSGAKQGVNDFGNIGYDGPSPPPGKPHRYFFKLYALDSETGLPPGTTKKDLLKAINPHILAKSELIGIYQR